MSPWLLLAVGWAGCSLVMLGLWRVAERARNATLVDAGWAGLLGVLAVFYALAADGDLLRRLLVAAMAGGWGLRLALLLHARWRSGIEDGRYTTLRSEWGEAASGRFLLFFQAQGLLCVVLSVPYLVAAFAPAEAPAAADLAGVALFILALGGEWLADRQLERFKRRPESRGRTCREGLWRYSRHPNYFFEWLHWWAWILLGLSSGWVWAACLAPLLMLLLILKVTGIPPTEAQALASRGEDYRQYQRSTSAFVPWFPKRQVRTATP